MIQRLLDALPDDCPGVAIKLQSGSEHSVMVYPRQGRRVVRKHDMHRLRWYPITRNEGAASEPPIEMTEEAVRAFLSRMHAL